MKKVCYLLLIVCNFINSGLAQNLTVAQYIDSFKNIAMQEMLTHKIPASITLAQGLLESGSGNSRLATLGNNHFGIKCKKNWTGCTILEDDDDLQECFRCYSNARESYSDHSLFLIENRRYAALFNLSITDYVGWAEGLLNAGYATNPKYKNLLISSIERNKLAQYDTLIINGYNPFTSDMPANIQVINPKNIPTTVVQPNQTIEVIAEQNEKSAKKLNKYNDLKYHHIEPGDVLYLKPKKRKASIEEHIVETGETMWKISQKYAIKLNILYRKNLMQPGSQPKEGVVLQMQHKAKKMPDTIIVRNRVTDNTSNYHIVQAGETLFKISSIYQISVNNLIEWNKLDGEQINIGQKLIVKKPDLPSEPNTIKHIVQQGETLYAISKKYQVTVEQIKEWNNLISDSLSLNQILLIKK